MCKKKIFVLIALAVCIISCKDKRTERFANEARSFTEKNCPQKMDEITTLDSMVFDTEGEGTLRLYYTLNVTEKERERFMGVLSDVGDANLETIKNSISLVKYKEAGVNFSYIYHDAATGDKLVQYDFTRNDYE